MPSFCEFSYDITVVLSLLLRSFLMKIFLSYSVKPEENVWILLVYVDGY